MQKFLLLSLSASLAVVRAILEDPATGTFSLFSPVSQAEPSWRRPDALVLSGLAAVPFVSLIERDAVNLETSVEAPPSVVNLGARQASQSSSAISTAVSADPVHSSTSSSWSPFLRMDHYRGLNIVNQSPTDWPSFKTAAEWDTAFAIVKTLPGNFNAVRLYSTTETGDGKDFNHLDLALPAAANHNLSIHAGVWSGGDAGTARFDLEKAALIHAIQNHGCKNIIAVSVGNEDILRSHQTPPASLTSINLLIQQINEISAVLNNNGCCNVPVTHTDTWAEWTDPQHEALVQAVDFLTINVFPYWENSTITEAHDQFWIHVNQTVQYAAQFHKEVWLGETGWPFNGSSMGAAVPSIENQQSYYSKTICSALNRMNAFIYAHWDYPDTAATGAPAFGLWDAITGKSRIDMSCP